jgi:hypothetical protein
MKNFSCIARHLAKSICLAACSSMVVSIALAQQSESVKLVKDDAARKVSIFIGNKPFTTFMYPENLEKPVLYPVQTAGGTVVTRGYPPFPGEPTDHPHHIGIWFNYESVNGLDFWNNSSAIAPEKKNHYGWIKTDKITEATSGKVGTLGYHANWTNQNNDVLLEENTRFVFNGYGHLRIIDRTTTLTASTEVLLKDVKDGLLGMRVTRALQIPATKDQKFTDDKGNVTIVKANEGNIENGTYLTSEGRQGDSAWSTRARWCKMYGKVGKDSISIVIIDHPQNINYPTFWHARGYGLFAANPLGESVFTNGKSARNLQLKKGESVTFRYRIVIGDGPETLTPEQINQLADSFSWKEPAPKNK